MNEPAGVRPAVGPGDLAGSLPGLVPGPVLRRTGKSVVVTGTFEGEAVVAKVLLDQDEQWRTRFAHEIAVYRAFRTQPPPVRTPALVHADERAAVIVLERIDGRVVARHRYPRTPLAAGDLTAVLDALGALNRWAPAGTAFGPALDYKSRLDRDTDRGLFRADDRRRLDILLARAGATTHEFSHGDALLANFVLADVGCALVDWEFCGFSLPGLDLALLWIVLNNVPRARAGIDELIRARGDAAVDGFVVNLAVMLAREIRIHRELAPDPARDAVLAGLEADSAVVRARLRERTS